MTRRGGLGAAWAGLRRTLVEERHLRGEVLAAYLTVLAAGLAKVSAAEWAGVIGAIGLVVSLEFVNTAVERTVDRVGHETHSLSRDAKDAAAAAVLMGVITSLGIAAAILLPKLSLMVREYLRLPVGAQGMFAVPAVCLAAFTVWSGKPRLRLNEEGRASE